MTKEEIINGNMTLAKFMGQTISITYNDADNKVESSINYHKDWDLLMLVFRKVYEEYNLDFTIKPMQCTIKEFKRFKPIGFPKLIICKSSTFAAAYSCLIECIAYINKNY